MGKAWLTQQQTETENAFQISSGKSMHIKAQGCIHAAWSHMGKKTGWGNLWLHGCWFKGPLLRDSAHPASPSTSWKSPKMHEKHCFPLIRSGMWQAWTELSITLFPRNSLLQGLSLQCTRAQTPDTHMHAHTCSLCVSLHTHTHACTHLQSPCQATHTHEVLLSPLIPLFMILKKVTSFRVRSLACHVEGTSLPTYQQSFFVPLKYNPH